MSAWCLYMLPARERLDLKEPMLEATEKFDTKERLEWDPSEFAEYPLEGSSLWDAL